MEYINGIETPFVSSKHQEIYNAIMQRDMKIIIRTIRILNIVLLSANLFFFFFNIS